MRGSRRRLRTLTVDAATLIRNTDPVQRNQFGVSWGRPSARIVATVTFGVVARNSAWRSGVGMVMPLRISGLDAEGTPSAVGAGPSSVVGPARAQWSGRAELSGRGGPSSVDDAATGLAVEQVDPARCRHSPHG